MNMPTHITTKPTVVRNEIGRSARTTEAVLGRPCIQSSAAKRAVLRADADV